MRAVKAALSVVVIALAVGLIAGLLMLFQRLLISGAAALRMRTSSGISSSSVGM